MREQIHKVKNTTQCAFYRKVGLCMLVYSLLLVTGCMTVSTDSSALTTRNMKSSHMTAACFSMFTADCMAQQGNQGGYEPKHTQVAVKKKVAVQLIPAVRHPYKKKIVLLGGKIIRLGESIRIILPADSLFNRDSANLINNNMAMLNYVIGYMHGFQLVTVKVAAYNDISHMSSTQLNKQLTTLQAQVIASYLWRKGVNVRLINSYGFGNKNKVADNTTDAGREENRRVEISFSFYPKYVGYS